MARSHERVIDPAYGIGGRGLEKVERKSLLHGHLPGRGCPLRQEEVARENAYGHDDERENHLCGPEKQRPETKKAPESPPFLLFQIRQDSRGKCVRGREPLGGGKQPVKSPSLFQFLSARSTTPDVSVEILLLIRTQRVINVRRHHFSYMRAFHVFFPLPIKRFGNRFCSKNFSISFVRAQLFEN
jgi:hypothetical protein